MLSDDRTVELGGQEPRREMLFEGSYSQKRFANLEDIPSYQFNENFSFSEKRTINPEDIAKQLLRD